MAVTVTMTLTLTDLWIDDDDIADMTDADILELIEEDVSSFAEDAKWTVTRDDQPTPQELRR